MRIERFPDASALAGAEADRFLSWLSEEQGQGHEPHVALTGGTIAEELHREIARRAASYRVDWREVTFWWGDERYVAPDSPDRNALAARRDFLDVVGATRVREIPSTADCPTVEEAAQRYAGRVAAQDAAGFDLVMLGLGPDGHVASLFPGFPQLDVHDTIAVPVTGSPKPPPERVSLTFPALNRTARVWFLDEAAASRL
jgi:6-phosphogluconolactonase